MSDPVDDEIAELIKKFGPKEVRTPNMTVVSHDVDKVVKAKKAMNPILPTMCSLGGCVGVPKEDAYKGKRS